MSTETEKLQHAAKLKSEYEGHLKCGRTDAAKETLEERDRLIEGMSPLERVMLRTDELDGNEIIQQVVDVILNREELTVEQLVTFFEHGITDLYETIAPAIDRCEEIVREELGWINEEESAND